MTTEIKQIWYDPEQDRIVMHYSADVPHYVGASIGDNANGNTCSLYIDGERTDLPMDHLFQQTTKSAHLFRGEELGRMKGYLITKLWNKDLQCLTGASIYFDRSERGIPTRVSSRIEIFINNIDLFLENLKPQFEQEEVLYNFYRTKLEPYARNVQSRLRNATTDKEVDVIEKDYEMKIRAMVAELQSFEFAFTNLPAFIADKAPDVAGDLAEVGKYVLLGIAGLVILIIFLKFGGK